MSAAQAVQRSGSALPSAATRKRANDWISAALAGPRVALNHPRLAFRNRVVNAAGQLLTVCRADAVVGKAMIRDAQRTYAVVVPSPDADAAPLEFRPGDELRLAEPPPRPLVIGVIERLVDPTLFTARLTAPDPPLATPLAVRAAGRTVGVALLVTANESQAGGFVLRCSTTRSLAEGMQLVYEAEPPARTDD